jgi:hypothetical protein
MYTAAAAITAMAEPILLFIGSRWGRAEGQVDKRRWLGKRGRAKRAEWWVQQRGAGPVEVGEEGSSQSRPAGVGWGCKGSGGGRILLRLALTTTT